MSDDKEKNTNKNKVITSSKEILFETTYEKVLFIINKVKEHLKKAMSSTETKLIEQLDWVIKVITDRSLYNYELVKEKLIKQNEEYDKFINFVKKYNEEVIQMNKKHDIVNELLSLRKKEDILLKPSLILKKIDDMNKVGEMQQKDKKNFIHTFGNYILNLYEKNKVGDKNFDVIMSKEENETNNINEVNNDEEKEIKENINQEENKKDNNKNNNEEEYMTINPKKMNSENINTSKKYKSLSENTHKTKNPNKKLNLKCKSNIKLLNQNIQDLPKKRLKGFSRLIRAERNNFNQMKGIMRNYYLNIAFKEQLLTNPHPNLFKIDFFNTKQSYNMTPMELFKKYIYTHEKSYNLYKTTKNSFLPYTMNKNKYNYLKNSKISLSLPLGFDANEEKLDMNYHKTTKKYFKTEKIFMSNKPNEKKKKSIVKNNIKIEKNNTIEENKNFISNKLEVNIKKRDKSISLDILINDYISEVETINTFDFNIFKLKKKIGYNNVLPLLGFAILKTLGLVDNKIITTKKLESFLKTVSDNYKITTLYHNSLHGADVTQSLLVFFMNSNLEEICETTVLDLLGLMISAMGHDLGHPGTNNAYHINASTELGITYNDKSCLENFHSSYLFRILRKDENNILEKFSVQNYKTIRKRIISQILATDMVYHSEIVSLIRAKIRAVKDQERFLFLSGNDKTKFDEQQLLLNYLIHMADLCHNCKDFSISIVWIELLSEEFWMQGDKEREQGLPVSFLCDRNNVDIPSSQIGFLKGFILSSFDCLVDMFPSLQFTIDNAEKNIKQWTQFQSEKRLRGWTPEKNKKKENDDDD